MVRKIIKPKTEEYMLTIPKEYIDTQVEILILPLSNKHDDALTKEQTHVLDERMKSFHEDRTIGRTWNEIKRDLKDNI